MMNLITQVHSEYNENLLTDNFKNINNISWTATNLTGATMVESEDHTYEEGKSLHLTINGYNVDETEFGPTTPDDYSFAVTKTGKYILSVRVYSPHTAPFFPELVGRFFLTELYGSPNTIPIEFNIGSNTMPEFTFQYRKWQTFYHEVTLTPGIYYLSGEIDKDVTWIAGPVEIYFAGFKLEYTGDKDYTIPTYYTPPNTNGFHSTSYLEVSSATFLEPYHRTVISNGSTTYNITLPSALYAKGKEVEVINKGTKHIELYRFGIDSIDGEVYQTISPGCSLKVKSDGVFWKITDKFRKETLNRTQWIQAIPLTAVNNATSLNLLTLIPNGSKAANGTDGGPNTLDITTDKIKVNWNGTVMSHHIRLGLTIETGTDQHYLLTLRRHADNSVLGVVQLNRNSDTGLCTADFLTYTYGPSDPFVTGGFYLSLDNNSGATMNITTGLNLLITTYFK